MPPTLSPTVAQPGRLLRPATVRRSAFFPLANPLVFLALHVPLALAMRASPLVSSLHAYCTLALGLHWVLQSKRIDRGIYVLAYVVGMELIWRGTGARLFYETGKYAVVLFAGLLLLRFHRLPRADKLPLLYFALLLPSLAVMADFNRKLISFNLSGPLCLAVATMLFSTIRMNQEHLKGILVMLLGPILGLAAIGTRSTFAAESLDLTFSTKVTTGGIGPNQVSSMLGLGAFVACLLLISHQKRDAFRLSMFVIALWLTGQNLLTFSRGGFWSSIGAIAVAAFYLLRDRRSRGATILRGGLVTFAMALLILPGLDAITGGELSKRFEDFDPSGRERLLSAELEAFNDNPIMGVGPGGSKTYYRRRFITAASHTEFTRLLAEHGFFGIMSLLVLILIAFRRWTRPMNLTARAIAMSFTAWPILFMLHSAMRLSAPSFIFALGSAYLLSGPHARAPARPAAGRAPHGPPAPTAPAASDS